MIFQKDIANYHNWLGMKKNCEGPFRYLVRISALASNLHPMILVKRGFMSNYYFKGKTKMQLIMLLYTMVIMMTDKGLVWGLGLVSASPTRSRVTRQARTNNIIFKDLATSQTYQKLQIPKLNGFLFWVTSKYILEVCRDR